MTAAQRASRAEAADAVCVAAYDGAGGPDQGVAFVAVGGFGRRELSPYSDLDLVLVHDDHVEPGDAGREGLVPALGRRRAPRPLRAVARRRWSTTAEDDLRVALGLLDVRHLAGDPNLTLRLRTTMLAAWRRHAPERLPALRELVRSRHDRVGELAHLSVPDLKEAEGGLRDATVLKALVATWLVDVPHADLERSRQALLDVRDLLHEASGRPTDRIGPESWADLAEALGLADALAVQTHVRELGRRITHLSRLTWRRVDAYWPGRPRGPGAGARGWRPSPPASRWPPARWCWTRGPTRPGPPAAAAAAAEAAERDVVLAPATPPGWCGRRRRSRSRGPTRRDSCWCACWRPDRGCCPSGRRWRRPARSASCSPSGSGSGCCRTRRRSTASRSTGTWSRPVARRPR